MNIVTILASGAGVRFGSNIPKQFHKINGKMVIEYVAEAILEAEKVDRALIVTNVELNKNYLTSFSHTENIDIINGGNTRNYSLFNALKFINDNYGCEKLIVCDAVRPMITSELIDSYLSLLDSNDAVVTAQKITDSLGCYDISPIHRDRYYLMQSPEGFNFPLLYSHFDPESKLTEVTQQLPKNSKIYLNFNFTNNFKLTYPADLKYLESLINAENNNVNYKKILDNVTRLNRYLYENYPSETKTWSVRLEENISNLLKKWQITEYSLIKTSHFGIIFLASSIKYGNCVLKIIPPFIGRYESEKRCYQKLSSSFMCELYDFDDFCSALLMKQLDDRKIRINGKLHAFFENVISSYSEIDKSDTEHSNYNDYEKILFGKANQNNFTYKKDKIMNYVNRAIELYKTTFSDKPEYLIHGDMHRYNLMYFENKIFAVDPIGYIAPYEFDIARFIATEFTENEAGISTNFDSLIDFFSDIADKDKLKSALFIDIIFRLHNSIFENDSFDLTDKWLRILEKIYG